MATAFATFRTELLALYLSAILFCFSSLCLSMAEVKP